MVGTRGGGRLRRGGDRNDGKEPTAECLANERCGLQEDRSCGLQEGGPARSVSTESIKWSKVLGRRGGLCLVDTLTGLITRRGSGTTGGALRCKRINGATASRESHTQTPDLGARLRPRTLTQTRHLGARSGAWSALRGARNGEKRGYTALHGSFTQRLDLGARSGVVGPDPRHGAGSGVWSPSVMDAVERSGAAALRWSVYPDVEARSGVWNSV